MKILRFEEFLNEQALNEIGEGVPSLPYKRVSSINVDKWMSQLSTVDRSNIDHNWNDFGNKIDYEFKTENANYRAKISGWFKKHVFINIHGTRKDREPPKYKLLIGVSFDVLGSRKEGITNFNEQFTVVSTVTDILEQVVKEITAWDWVKIDEIHIAPKLEDSDEGKPITQTKRGRLYLAYIQKQGNRLPGTWTAEITNDRFIIRSGKWSAPHNPEKFINL